MVKLHLVFDADAEALAEVLKRFTLLTGWDYTLDTAAQWAASKKGETPDIMLINGACDISSVDTNTGALNRDNAVLKRLTEMKISRPESRIIILLPPEKEKGKDFLGGLVSLGIYDIYFVNEFNEESIQNWIETAKSLADVQHLLPHVVPTGENAVTEVKFHKSATPTKATVPQQAPVPPQKNVILIATGEDSINESITTSIPGQKCKTVIANSKESLLEKVIDVEPDIVLLSYGLPGEIDILEVVYQVKQVTDKVVFIPGLMVKNDITLVRIKEMGTEILAGDVSIGAILKAIGTLLGEQQDCDLYFAEEPENGEKTFSRLVRVGGEIAKNIPSVHMPKIQLKKKRQNINEKVIALVSPVPAGKTFVSVNLATTLAKSGYTVALVDADLRQQSVFDWFKMEPGEASLVEALKDEDPLVTISYRPPMVPNLHVFTTDPAENKALTANVKDLVQFLEVLSEGTDIIIVDTSRNLTEPVTKTVLDLAAQIVFVADLDYSHLNRLQLELDRNEKNIDFNRCSLILNRNIDLEGPGQAPGSDSEDINNVMAAAGINLDCVIPDRPYEVLKSIKAGMPVANFCPDIKNALGNYWYNREKSVLKAQ